MTRIFGWQADQQGCGWYRIKLPLDALVELGHSVGYSCDLNETPAEWAGEPPEVLIGQRVSNLAASVLWQALSGQDGALRALQWEQPGLFALTPGWVWRVLREEAPRPRLVYELDDDLFSVAQSNKLAYATFGKSDVQQRIRMNLQVSAQVTVSTDPLAAALADQPGLDPAALDIHVVPNYLPDWLPERGEALPTAWTPTTVVGWAGSATHQEDVAECAPYVRRFLDRTPGAELHTVGMRWGSERYTPWSKSVEDFYRTLDFDIGLAPLRPSVFNRSKSAIKVMEYQALGIVPVASNVGPYADYLRDGEDGLLVDRPHQWATALRELASDPGTRAQLARAGWERARTLTIGQHVDEWASALGVSCAKV
ncbi:MAG TPA: glycosyltransferase [Pseudonocardiaceae bacterium]|nr:glycosyltransferase [Pseudonocardiaceae bacterium]